MGLTFEEFKSRFELFGEISAVLTMLGGVAYKMDVFRAIWKVARGQASTADQDLALQAMERGGAVAEQAIERAASVVRNEGHENEAGRLDDLRSGVSHG